MIPTFLGATFLVFLILQLVPGGPFDKAVMQLKAAEMQGSGEGGAASGSRIAGSEMLSPEQLANLRRQYGLDKPILVRYLIWLGFYPRNVNEKTIGLSEPFRETLRYVSANSQTYAIQRWVKIEKDNSGKPQFFVSGVGSDFKFSDKYPELPNFTEINNWMPNSEWKIDKEAANGQYATVKPKFSGILTGDLGMSDKFRRPVISLIADRLHISAYFGIIGFIVTYLVCIPLGIAKAIKHNSNFDVVSSAIIFLGYSIPAFAMGVLLLVLFGGGSFWDVIPLGGFRPDNWEELTFVQKIIGQLKHTIAPLLCYLIGSFATLTMLMKNSLLENLGLDYVRTAFAKGLPEKKVVLKHAVRNSLIPIATGLGHFIGIFLTGSYLLEKVFNIHGIGLLGFEAVLGLDYPLIMGSLVISIVILLLGNLISDLLYVAVDPRIKFN